MGKNALVRLPGWLPLFSSLGMSLYLCDHCDITKVVVSCGFEAFWPSQCCFFGARSHKTAESLSYPIMWVSLISKLLQWSPSWQCRHTYPKLKLKPIWKVRTTQRAMQIQQCAKVLSHPCFKGARNSQCFCCSWTIVQQVFWKSLFVDLFLICFSSRHGTGTKLNQASSK